MQALISRRQDNDKAAANIRWLVQHSNAHLHVDLIAGLPGEDVASFARGFDRLWELGPHEIQFGILKRLRGTPIIRHTAAFGLVFDPHPPYAILATDRIDFAAMQRLVRFARYWDLIANSGRFANTLPLILGAAPFARFMALSDWLYLTTDATHRIALERLAALLLQWLQTQDVDAEHAGALLASDQAGRASRPPAPVKSAAAAGKLGPQALPPRQARRRNAAEVD